MREIDQLLAGLNADRYEAHAPQLEGVVASWSTDHVAEIQAAKGMLRCEWDDHDYDSAVSERGRRRAHLGRLSGDNRRPGIYVFYVLRELAQEQVVVSATSERLTACHVVSSRTAAAGRR